MDRIFVFIAALVPALLILEYGVAKTRASWTNEAFWAAFMVGAVSGLGAVFAELGVAHVVGLETLSGLTRAGVEAVLIAAIPEESIKFVVLLTVAVRHVDARRYQDIVVLSLAVGLGFAALENLLYLVSSDDWPSVAARRALTSVPGHAVDALAMGALVTFARLTPGHRRFLLLLSLAAPVLLHAAYDFPLLATKSDDSSDGAPWVIFLWPLVMILSAIVALPLSKRALRKAADADYLAGRDRRPAARSLSLVLKGLVLFAVAPSVALASCYSANAPLWVGALTCILPVALGLDLIVTGSLPSSRTFAVPETSDVPLVGG